MAADQTLPGNSPALRPIRWHSHLLSMLIALGTVPYLCLFWVRLMPWMPTWLHRTQRGFQSWAAYTLRSITRAVGVQDLDVRWVWAIISVTLGIVVPWLLMAALGRGRPRDIGLRWPNRIGWRLIVFGYFASLPLLYLMALSPAMQAYYRRELTSIAFGQLAATYLAVLVAEHFLFHGVILALLRPGRRWPAPPPVARVEGKSRLRVLRWLGLAQPPEMTPRSSRIARWLGLPEGCLWAMTLQALLFGLVHFGKAPAELLMSFPGGLALAYVAYRCNSFLVPMLLHAATALTTLGFVWLR